MGDGKKGLVATVGGGAMSCLLEVIGSEMRWVRGRVTGKRFQSLDNIRLLDGFWRGGWRGRGERGLGMFRQHLL